MKVTQQFPTGTCMQKIEETYDWTISGTRVAIFFFRDQLNNLKQLKEDYEEI